MTHQQFKMQPWHIFSGVFLAFWILMSYFDNIIITLILCVGAGFATDNLNQFMKGAGKKKRQILTSASSDLGGPEIFRETNTTNDFCPSKPLPPEPLIEDEDDLAAEDIMEEMRAVDDRFHEKIIPSSSEEIDDRFHEKKIMEAEMCIDRRVHEKNIPSSSEEFDVEDRFHEKNINPSSEEIMSEQQTQHVREQIKDALEDDEDVMEDFMEPNRSDPVISNQSSSSCYQAIQETSNPPQISTDQFHEKNIIPPSPEEIKGMSEQPQPDLFETSQKITKDNLIKSEDSDDDEDSIEGDYKVQKESNCPAKSSDDSDDSLEITKPSKSINDEDFFRETNVLQMGNPEISKKSESPNLMDDSFHEEEHEQPKKVLVIDDEPVIKVQQEVGAAAADGDLLGDFSTTTEILRETNIQHQKIMGNPEILKDIPSRPEITADLLADIHPATSELLADFRENAPPPPPPPVFETGTGTGSDSDFVPPPPPEAVLIPEGASADLDSSLIQHVASTSLAEHEQELANLMKGTIEEEVDNFQFHEKNKDEIIDFTKKPDSDDDDVDMELEAVASKGKDEGDPWILDERDVLAPEPLQVHAGESLVHLDSEELAAKDDISHCAVFGDDVEPDDLDLDEDEKKMTSTGSSAGSSSSVGPEDEDQPVLLDLNQSSKSDEERKSSSSSSEEAVEAEQGLSKGGTCLVDFLQIS